MCLLTVGPLAFLVPGKGSCTVVIRVRRDYANDVLPFAPPTAGYLPTSGLPLQTDTWARVYGMANGVLDTCVRREKTPGWGVIGEDIVVAFWPRGSFIDQAYGLYGNGGGVEDAYLKNYTIPEPKVKGSVESA